MQILFQQYFKDYVNSLQIDLQHAMQQLHEIELTPQTFTFYTSVAVIASSKIEGEVMEVDSYIKHKTQNIEYLPELTQKPNDLFEAYTFAKKNKLNKDNFLHCHVLLSKHLLPEKWRGKYRQNEMVVMEHNTGKIQFEAAPFSIIHTEMEKLWNDVEMLITEKLTTEAIFYYAAFIHLVFVNIHPFNDGNGRAARLLEKWFLVTMLGEEAWYIQSEKYYYQHVNEYYKNLNRLGIFYDQLNYANANNFLQMLPQSLVV
ncbi:MAG: hypothetical protein C0459_06215 [Chitinophaga sp.]|jgi:Fic family protein|nr:hypothetical protein [Chitinophaga sp.]